MRMVILISLCAFMPFAVSADAERPQPGAPTKPILILMASELSPGLQGSGAFQGWCQRLHLEGYDTTLITVPKNSETLPYYLACLRKKTYAGCIFVGSLSLPVMRLHARQVPGNRPSRQLDVHTMLPLMNPHAAFPPNGLTALSGRDFYAGLSTWTGVISDRYRWEAASWVKILAGLFGAGEPGTADRLKKYIAYFQRNIQYRCNLPAKSDLSVIAFEDDPFKTKKHSIFHSTLASKLTKINALADLASLGDKPFDLCEIKAHGVRNGLGVEDYLGGGSDQALRYHKDQFAAMFPRVRFTVLNVCASAAPRSGPSLAQSLLFRNDHALGVFASTTVGGIGDSRRLYPGLLAGKSLGHAFRNYLSERLRHDRHQFYRVAYHAGTIFWGDPTLKLVQAK